VPKLFNAYESISLMISNQPFQKTQQLEGTMLISSTSGVSSRLQLNSIVPSLLELERGVICMLVAPICGMLGDNPRQSTMASHKTMSAHANCRLCFQVQSDPVHHISQLRNKNNTLEILRELKVLNRLTNAQNVIWAEFANSDGKISLMATVWNKQIFSITF
jgi:hypothetical protein